MIAEMMFSVMMIVMMITIRFSLSGWKVTCELRSVYIFIYILESSDRCSAVKISCLIKILDSAWLSSKVDLMCRHWVAVCKESYGYSRTVE